MDSIQQTLTVLGVLGLLAGLLWWLRARGLAQFPTRGAARKARQMQMVERLALTPQHSLQLVRVAEQVILIAVSPAGCSLISTYQAHSPLDSEAVLPPEIIR